MASQGQPPAPGMGPPIPQADFSAIKLTRGTSCVLCQQRKVRCDKQKPCSNCVKAGAECRVVPPQPPRRRKKRLQERDLLERLRKYEDLLRQHNIKFDALDHDNKSEATHEDVEELENDFENLRTSPSERDYVASLHARGARWKLGSFLKLHNKTFHGHDRLLNDSSDDEADYPTVYKAFDKMFTNQNPFPFLISDQQIALSDYRPSTIHMFQLWQVYIDNVNPLLKLTHVPTIQQQVIAYTGNPDESPKNMEALMFAIFLMAVSSLDEQEVQQRLQADKQELLGQFFAGLQQALINANFMRSSDIVTLQAFLLYMLAIRWFLDPRHVFSIMGMMVRMAHHMGLHRDPAGQGLNAYESELRRRLWWSIAAYDRRIGEMTGAAVTALAVINDTRIPLNINDADLYVEQAETPTAHKGATEMMFALIRAELAMATPEDWDRDFQSPQPTDQPAGKVLVRLLGKDKKTYTIDGFCAHIEGTYLVHCDPSIPFHFFTLIMTRQALSRLRVMIYLVRLADGHTSTTDETDRQFLFVQATQMLEHDNILQSRDNLKCYRWFTHHHFPFPAYMFLVNELRFRLLGPEVDRAWTSIATNHSLRGMMHGLHSPMHLAFGHLFVKAWKAREGALLEQGQQATPPNFIVVLQEFVERRRRAKAQNLPDPLEEPPEVLTVPKPSPTAYSTPGSHSDSGIGKMTPMMANSPTGAPMSQAPPPTTNLDDTDMDWSYILSGYQDGSIFQNFNTFHFGGDPSAGMGGMGGMGGGMGMNMGGGPNMFGN
ncbi:hypothetical protein V2A60_003537 [Cordyceps javanica]